MESPTMDRLVRLLDGPMVVVTVGGPEPAGCLVGFHGQISIDPPRYGIWISRENATNAAAKEAGFMAVHALSSDDHHLAEAFGARSGPGTFDDIAITRGPGGLPLVDRLPHRLIGRILSERDLGGDHDLFILEPLDAGDHDDDGVDEATEGRFEALRLTDADDIEPGNPR